MFPKLQLTCDVLLTECCLQKDIDVHLDEFDSYVISRQKSRSTQCGGIVVLIL